MATQFDDHGYYERVTGPVEALLSLSEVKQHVRVMHSDEDAVLQQLLDQAIDYLDGPRGCLGLALVKQVWRCNWPCPPTGRFELKLPCGPVLDIESATYLNRAGEETELDVSKLWVRRKLSENRVMPSEGTIWPAMSSHPEALKISVSVGFGGAVDVPGDIKRAALLMIGHWFENREAVVVGTIASEVPMSVQSLINKNRVGWVAG